MLYSQSQTHNPGPHVTYINVIKVGDETPIQQMQNITLTVHHWTPNLHTYYPRHVIITYNTLIIPIGRMLWYVTAIHAIGLIRPRSQCPHQGPDKSRLVPLKLNLIPTWQENYGIQVLTTCIDYPKVWHYTDGAIINHHKRQYMNLKNGPKQVSS